MKKIKLFCLPYAGGSAAVYNKWKLYLDKHIQLISPELAGRGKRIYDPLYKSLKEAIDDIYSLIAPQLDDGPYALFGHSMGNIFSYELAYKLRENNHPAPLHIFFSGRGAPDMPKEPDEEVFHTLPDDKFKDKVIELGGTPKEFFEHPELLEVLLPMLRSDFSIAETYLHDSQVIPFDHDISVFIGKDESVSAKQLNGWAKHSKGLCTLYYCPGNHFFINQNSEKLVSIINETILKEFREKTR